MKPSQVIEALRSLRKAKLAGFLTGAPGIGKSQLVREAFADIRVIDTRLSMHEASDFAFPVVRPDGVHFAVPSYFPRDGEGVWFFDELPNAPRATQSMALQIILDRRCGQEKVGDGWTFVAAGNRSSDRAGAEKMISSLSARFVHINVDVDANEWSLWAIRNGLAHEVIAFLRLRPEQLHSFDPARTVSPNPRGWEFVSRMMATAPAVLVPDLATGIVGESAGLEFAAFLETWAKLPRIDDVLANPTTHPVPHESNVLYALMGAMAKAITPKNIGAATTFLDRVVRQELAAFCISMVMQDPKRRPSIMKTQEWVKWASEHVDMILP